MCPRLPRALRWGPVQLIEYIVDECSPRTSWLSTVDRKKSRAPSKRFADRRPVADNLFRLAYHVPSSVTPDDLLAADVFSVSGEPETLDEIFT
ncbi:hypothetical protein DIPPA_07073 [Diplonema papillatum]|nr:hypothetical protein DIPPA_07073 [Diplonema papillatum]